MKYKLINFPQYIPIERYDTIIGKVCNLLSHQEGILSIYQVGSVSNPGISDIDLVAVFKDGVKCDVDPLSCLDREERYLFTHSVFVIGETFFKKFPIYSLFQNYSWYWGSKFEFNAENNNNEALKKQVALEYLLANYIARTRDKLYGVLSVRNLLLSCSAIGYDLELLNAKGGALYDNIRELKTMRHNWFDYNYSAKEIQTWFESFYSSLNSFLVNYFKKNKLWVPEIRNYRFSRDIYIIPHHSMEYKFKGVLLPAFITRFHKKLKKLNGLVSRFKFYVPMMDCSTEEDGILNQRNTFFRLMLKKHRVNFPYFTPLVNNLQMKLLI
ncbi:MAG: hypothetical protein GTO45_36615 [Candidatus Aminicenantes bacterium]|nr:hypothetical protein [Candidatus Aminicenantes bacterium]NIM84226.1 hypothetical protein [Candidatus Aminicenantes bacterium]NIN23675.1 hypothetical protein [Candidatus Aminicenantes bacterium]NIN47382.1 hypothetical protein [Candidatus Aminicenantes bacterium]NIN90310.1 hypothetical protein [Candidatus Aminicenantes bacterium]